MGKVNIKELKQSGFMPQIQKDHFSVRLRIAGGQIKAEQLNKVHDIALKFGQGNIHMTSRQSIEIPFIKLEDVETVKEELSKVGLEPGTGGPKVRTITACQGNAVCSSGLIDSAELAKEFDERYYARELPHKFKLGITGCRNNCLKAEENDLGVKGGMQPSWIEGSCSFCGLCEAVCAVKAIQVQKDNKTLLFSQNDCINCGNCIKTCPTKAWSGKIGYTISFGGLYGKRIAIGKQLIPILFSKEDVHTVVETTLEFFRKYGKSSERFRNTLDRVGWDLFQNDLDEALKQ